MKKTIVLCMLAAMYSMGASAQEVNKAECNRRCMTFDGFTSPGKTKIDKKLAEIRAKKKEETDPAKLKALAQDEEDQLDALKDDREMVCRKICALDD